MINRASIKLEKLPMLMSNQGTNTDSIFCTYTKCKAISPSAKKKHIMTNAFIRAKTSMLLLMREQTVNISERKLDCDFNASAERDKETKSKMKKKSLQFLLTNFQNSQIFMLTVLLAVHIESMHQPMALQSYCQMQLGF